jgi:prepilin-type N-terminal cleavage/methylation domain-containing protein
VPLPVRRQAGFSLIELIVAVLVAVILLAIALPIFLRAYRSYQLTNASRQVADILRLTRYQAIRMNKQVNCVFQPYSGDSTMMSASMTDKSGNFFNASTGIGTGTIVLLGVNGNLVAAGSVPGTLPASANLGSAVPTAFNPAGGTIQFDARGSVIWPAGVNAFYLASPAASDAGYRAVLLMPSGSMQIWSIDSSGYWQELR